MLSEKNILRPQSLHHVNIVYLHIIHLHVLSKLLLSANYFLNQIGLFASMSNVGSLS